MKGTEHAQRFWGRRDADGAAPHATTGAFHARTAAAARRPPHPSPPLQLPASSPRRAGGGGHAHRHTCAECPMQPRAPASLSAGSLRPRVSPLLVSPTAWMPGRARRPAVMSTRSRRNVGSPPVSRTLSTPAAANRRACRRGPRRRSQSAGCKCPPGANRRSAAAGRLVQRQALGRGPGRRGGAAAVKHADPGKGRGLSSGQARGHRFRCDPQYAQAPFATRCRLTRRSTSAVDSRSPPGVRSTPSSGMQYRQRKLHRSVSEMRR